MLSSILAYSRSKFWGGRGGLLFLVVALLGAASGIIFGGGGGGGKDTLDGRIDSVWAFIFDGGRGTNKFASGFKLGRGTG